MNLSCFGASLLILAFLGMVLGTKCTLAGPSLPQNYRFCSHLDFNVESSLEVSHNFEILDRQLGPEWLLVSRFGTIPFEIVVGHWSTLIF